MENGPSNLDRTISRPSMHEAQGPHMRPRRDVGRMMGRSSLRALSRRTVTAVGVEEWLRNSQRIEIDRFDCLRIELEKSG